jgi:hypothetical protein
MFSNKFVVCVKNNGKVLREHGTVVYIPFGSEYSILLKNLNTVRANVSITIDGQDVLNGNSIVVAANSSVELERYLKDLNTGNRFKFVERTDSVEQYRGVGAEDGLIRIEYQFENPWLMFNGICGDIHAHGPMYTRSVGYYNKGDTARSVTSNNAFVNQEVTDTSTYSPQSMIPVSYVSNDIGITAPGSLSNQKFTTVAPMNLESDKHVIVLQIKGETEDNKQVVQPVTVKQKPKCQTCGRSNKANAKFCSNCGTSLEVV